MAEPAQLVAEVAGDGYLRIGFKQGEEWMLEAGGFEPAMIVLQYPRQGERMRKEGDQSETERKAALLNQELLNANLLLDRWCS